MITMHVHVDLSSLERYRSRWRDPAGPIADMKLKWAARYRGWAQKRFDEASKGDGTWEPLAPSTLQGRVRAPVARLGLALATGQITSEEYRKKLPKAQAKVKAAIKRFGKKINAVAGSGGDDPFGTYGGMSRSKKLEALQGSFSILRDTGTLFRVLDPVFQNQPGALQEMVEDGIIVGFGGPSTYAEGNGLVTIADIASFHQQGNERLPRREIIVDPPQEVISDMVTDAENAANKIAQEARRP